MFLTLERWSKFYIYIVLSITEYFKSLPVTRIFGLSLSCQSPVGNPKIPKNEEKTHTPTTLKKERELNF